MTEVSFLLSVRGNPEKFEKALLSMLHQNYPNVEVVIVLDRAGKDIEDCLDKYNYTNLVVVPNPNPKNLAKSLNLGVKHASGKWIARLDADDIAHPDRISKQLAIATKSASNTIMVSSNAENLEPKKTAKETIKLSKADFLFDNPIIHPTTLISKDYLLTNPYNEKYKYSQDYELWTRIIFDGEILVMPDKLIEFDDRKRDAKYVLSQERYFLQGNFRFIVKILLKSKNEIPLNTVLLALACSAKRSINLLWNLTRLYLGRFN